MARRGRRGGKRRGLRKSQRRRYEEALRAAGWTKHETEQGERWRPSYWDPDRGISLGWGIRSAYRKLEEGLGEE